MARYRTIRFTELEISALKQLAQEADLDTFESSGTKREEASRRAAAARALEKLRR